jgi:hypothetical protein
MHQVLVEDVKGDPDLLFRVTENANGDLIINTQSSVEPTWKKLKQMVGDWSVELSNHQKQNLSKDEILVFRLLGSTTKQSKGIRFLYEPNEQREWLFGKLKEVAEILSIDTQKVEGRYGIKYSRQNPSEKIKIMHRCTYFEGTLKVIDPAGLEAIVKRGIGRGKSFGLGLLTLEKVA